MRISKKGIFANEKLENLTNIYTYPVILMLGNDQLTVNDVQKQAAIIIVVQFSGFNFVLTIISNF
jgi:hypothetical protein